MLTLINDSVNLISTKYSHSVQSPIIKWEKLNFPENICWMLGSIRFSTSSWDYNYPRKGLNKISWENMQIIS